jgi:hypothetical protein
MVTFLFFSFSHLRIATPASRSADKPAMVLDSMTDVGTGRTEVVVGSTILWVIVIPSGAPPRSCLSLGGLHLSSFFRPFFHLTTFPQHHHHHHHHHALPHRKGQSTLHRGFLLVADYASPPCCPPRRLPRSLTLPIPTLQHTVIFQMLLPPTTRLVMRWQCRYNTQR